MRAAVLLSLGRHPETGRPRPSPLDARALQLALWLGAKIEGLHAGGSPDVVRDFCGHGLDVLKLLEIPAGCDPVPALIEALRATRPALVLAGRRGEGGDDTGLVPYAIAQSLGYALVSDAVAVATPMDAPDRLVVDQALPRGERRRVTVRLPAVVTVHGDAPPPRPFAFAAMRRGRIERVLTEPVPLPAATQVEKPYRARPKLMANAPAGGSALDRLKAATETAQGGGRLLVDPDPDDAAREILTFLRGLGLLERREPPASG